MSSQVVPGRRNVLITGCTPGGIGHELALEYHRKGCHVIATARSLGVLEGLKAMGMSTLVLDVTKAESVAACKKQVEAITGGKLDILVNNAGRTHTIPATDIDMDDVRATFETNVFGVFAMIQALVPLLIAARGLIVNIASLSAISPYTFGSVYCASKGAVVRSSRTLRAELRPLGVRVMVVMAGFVRSNISGHGHRSLPPGSLYRPVEGIFTRRLDYSQRGRKSMPTDEFARGLVASTLRGEGWFGGLIGGTPDRYWSGGMSRLVWLGSWVGDWLVDLVAGYMFNLAPLARYMADNAQKKLV